MFIKTIFTLFYILSRLVRNHIINHQDFQAPANCFITDYPDDDDIRDNIKNSFITEFANYLVFNTR